MLFVLSLRRPEHVVRSVIAATRTCCSFCHCGVPQMLFVLSLRRPADVVRSAIAASRRCCSFCHCGDPQMFILPLRRPADVGSASAARLAWHVGTNHDGTWRHRGRTEPPPGGADRLETHLARQGWDGADGRGLLEGDLSRRYGKHPTGATTAQLKTVKDVLQSRVNWMKRIQKVNIN